MEVSPPDGKASFSGIPESQFIEDVETYMKGEDSAEAKIKSFDEVRAETVQRDFCLFVIKNLF